MGALSRICTPVIEEPLSRLALVLLFSVVLLAFWVSFSANVTCLLHGFDGTDWTMTLDVQASNRTLFSQSGVDPLQGSFDAYFPVSREYLLPNVLTWALGTGSPSGPFMYWVYTLLMFVAAYALARAVGVGQMPALFGGLLLPILTMPVLAGRNSFLYPIFGMNPIISQNLSLSMFLVAALWALPVTRGARQAALIPVPMLCLVLCILAAVPYVALMIPAVVCYGGAALLSVRRWRDNLPRLLAGALMLIAPAALGMLQYVYGLTKYTAYNFFTADFEQTRSALYFASILYQRSMISSLIIVGGLIGAIGVAWLGSGRVRLAAIAHVVATVLFQLIVVAIVVFATAYQGPSPVYFEIFFWPYSVIFTGVALLGIVRALLSHAQRRLGLTGVRIAAAAGRTAYLAVVILLISHNLAAGKSPKHNECDAGFVPIKPTPITERLRTALELGVGKSFRGLVATVDGVGDRASTSWLELAGYDYALWKKLGNDQRVIGLRYYGIPTLLHYTSYITPPYYLLLTEFLTRPDDRPMRSIIVPTRLEPRMLRLWGVRFVITDLDTDIGPVVTELVTDTHPLRLIELPDANLGGYSPTQIRQVGSYADGLRALHDQDFDGRRTLIVDTDLRTDLVPATDSRLVYETYGFHLTAQSQGRSVLVLPVQYSHCWSISGTGAPTLFRANMMQLGVSFGGAIDARLVFRYGPLNAGTCRIEDLRDVERLDIRAARTRASASGRQR